MTNHEVLEKYPPSKHSKNNNNNSTLNLSKENNNNNNMTIDNNSAVLSNEHTGKEKENGVNDKPKEQKDINSEKQ